MIFNNLKTQQKKIKNELNKSIQKVLNHCQFILGPEVNEIEKKLAKYVGVKFCLGFSSCTDSLMASLMSLNIEIGDEVITPSFSYISAAECIVRLGAKPIFVDVDLETCCIIEKNIEKNITNKTKAILPISLFGNMPNYNLINKIAKKNKISVIEDGAQSFGSSYKGKKSCSLTSIGCTSFFPNKSLGCYGDGGAVFTNNKNLFKSLQEIRIHGQKEKYFSNSIGILGRLDTIQAAILLSKLKLFKKEILLRKKIVNRYISAFSQLDTKNIRFLNIHQNCKSNYSHFIIISRKRNLIQNELSKINIPSFVYYPYPITRQKPYRSYYSIENSSNADYLSKNILSLPTDPYMSKSRQNNIIQIIKKYSSF